MKVHRRGASSPSLLLEASEPPTSVNVNDNYYQFELEPHHVERGKRGQKIFVCDLCPAPGGVFKRSFSLKRHYLRFHINFAFLSPRDVNNCAIAVAGQHQRSGFPASGPNDRLINRLNNPSPLLFRCHHCGRLLRTKNDLLKHLESHGGPSQAVTADLVNGDRQQGGTNRCPRCSTAFSLRKTLLRHVKKNQCRGGNQSPPELPGPPSKPESETGLQSGETSEAGDDFLAISPAEESEEMDMEASLKLGCPAPVFRFACTLCSKMFNSYINMCRHRRGAHGRYGICSPGWLLSRKLSGKPTLHQSTLSPMISSGNQINSQDLLLVISNANENLNRFLDGKTNHIRSVAPADDRFDVEASDGDPPPPQRWSWGETNHSVSEVHKLDVPIQMAYFNGLQSWKLQEIVKTDGNSSQAGPEDLDISKALNLLPAKTNPTVTVETATRQPEFSGEWIRRKRYICSPCGEIFHDFLALLDHQQKGHNGIWCTHIQLDQSIEVDLAGELTRQITRSGTGGLNLPPNTYQCTKCHFVVESIPELHSHILLCSNHVSASPSRKRRLKVNPSSRRSHWNQPETKNGRSRGMQRTISSQTKNPSATRSLRNRSPKEDAVDKDAPAGVLRRSARRVLSFSEPPPTKKKKGIVTKRLLRQRVSLQQVNGSVTPVRPHNDVKKRTTLIVANSTPKSSTDLHECDGCQKKFQSHTSVLKHKHYCPKKLIESMEGRTQLSAPEKKQSSVRTKVQTKKLIQDSGKVKSNVGSSSNKRKSDALPSSPVNDSRSASHDRTNGSHPTISNAQKKKSTSFPSPAMPSQVLSAKSPIKSKLLKKDSGSSKSHRKTTKNGSVKEERETEETPVAVERRPVRSSRKVSMVLVMEDQVEASFLEALSPEQRVRVTEQRCPFCSKHYVYRSNFKRHLLEGCDAIDEDELSANLSSMINKDGKQTDAISSSSELKMYRKEKRNQSLEDYKTVGNKSQKKAVEQRKNDVSEERSKKAKIVVKKNDNVSNSKSAKSQEPKKSTENRTAREAVTKSESTRKSARKAKQIPQKQVVLKNQQQKKAKSSVTQADSNEKKKVMDISKDKKKKIVKPSSDMLGFPRNTNKKTNMKPSSSFSLTNKKLVKSNDEVSSQDEEELAVAIEYLPEPNSNGIREGDDQKQTFLTETESKQILTKGERVGSEATIIGNKGVRTIDDCQTSSTSTTDCTIQRDQVVSKAITSNCSESHALDRLQLGQALEKAIKSGIFKSYSRLTKYPTRMRRLKDMAQAYLQSTR